MFTLYSSCMAVIVSSSHSAVPYSLWRKAGADTKPSIKHAILERKKHPDVPSISVCKQFSAPYFAVSESAPQRLWNNCGKRAPPTCGGGVGNVSVTFCQNKHLPGHCEFFLHFIYFLKKKYHGHSKDTESLPQWDTLNEFFVFQPWSHCDSPRCCPSALSPAPPRRPTWSTWPSRAPPLTTSRTPSLPWRNTVSICQRVRRCTQRGKRALMGRAANKSF